MPAGVYPLPSGGYRAVACISRTQRREKRFPKGTALRAIARWQEDTRAELRAEPIQAAGSLGADIDAYLAARASMPTAKERTMHLRAWAARLGGARHRDTVTALEVRTALEQWLAARNWEGPTANRYRTALQSFYTVLNGPHGHNPARDAAKFDEHDQPPRRLDYATVDAILALMPDHGRPDAGDPRSSVPVSQTKARLRVLAYTGLPHMQIAQLKPEHLVASERLLLVQGRHKGRGTATGWRPISARGVEAVQALFAAKATGSFSRSSMWKSFKRAAVKAGRPDLRPYDLRHLFGQTVLRLTRSRATTRDLMLHRSDRTTARYVAAEIPAELRAALDAFDRDVVASGCGTTADTGRRKRRKS